LGSPKQLLPYRGTTLLEWVVKEVCRATRLDQVLVVLHADLIPWAAQRAWEPATIVTVEDPTSGCSASYRAGLDRVQAGADAVVIVLGDQPGVRAEVIDRLVGAWQERRAPLALVRYRGEPGHPLLFGRPLFEELMALRGDKAAWKLVDRHLEEAVVLEVDEPSPVDVDTWADYRAVLGRDAEPMT
jgi:molybdenum cofactor cytidylyltransferase